MRSELLSMCALMIPALTGCELMVPLALAAGGAGSAPIPDYGYETVELEVEIVEASGRVGEVDLATTPLVPTGWLSGTSTTFALQAEAVPDPRDGTSVDPALVQLDLCPVEDVMLNGDASSAFVYLVACEASGACLDGASALHVAVREDDAGRRTVVADTVLEDGAPLHLVLAYPSPL